MSKPSIAVIGGTGAEGSGLALRWAAAGYRVMIGSRSVEKAEASVAELNELLPAGTSKLRGLANADAAATAEIIVLSVPYGAQQNTLADIAEQCRGKVVISVVAPLQPPKVSTVWQPTAGSAAQEAQAQLQAALGDDVQVVAAFQNISATHLKDLNWQPDCDVLVTGDAKAAKQITIELAQAAGFFGIDAGPLANSSVVEGFTAILIGINIRHKVKGSGIRITGIPR
ncbi:MAG: NADPH-dependent F420 reductase [Caldilineaceae bacterium]